MLTLSPDVDEPVVHDVDPGGHLDDVVGCRAGARLPAVSPGPEIGAGSVATQRAAAAREVVYRGHGVEADVRRTTVEGNRRRAPLRDRQPADDGSPLTIH